MKLRVTFILILLGLVVSTSKAQSNCCEIQPGSPQEQGNLVVVPPSGSNPGGRYYSSITTTTVISCINTSTSKPCSSAATPNNVVTATGIGAYSPARGQFVACSPVFVPTTTQSPPRDQSEFFESRYKLHISGCKWKLCSESHASVREQHLHNSRMSRLCQTPKAVGKLLGLVP